MEFHRLRTFVTVVRIEAAPHRTAASRGKDQIRRVSWRASAGSRIITLDMSAKHLQEPASPPSPGCITLIRRADSVDAESLDAVRRSSILGLSAPSISNEEAERWAGGAGADRITRAIREHSVWVAVREAAFGWIEVDCDRVNALYVAPEFARRGVGSALLCVAETSIQRAGYAAARLLASRNALDFYLHRGYLRSGPVLSDGSHPMTKHFVRRRSPVARCLGFLRQSLSSAKELALPG